MAPTPFSSITVQCSAAKALRRTAVLADGKYRQFIRLNFVQVGFEAMGKGLTILSELLQRKE